MLQLSVLQLISITFPEYLLLSYVGLNLVGIKTDIYNYFKIAVICTFILGIVRNIFDLYGLHTLVMISILAVAIKFIIDLELKIAAIISLLGFILLGLGETIIIILGMNLFQLKMEIIVNNKRLAYLFSYIGKLPLLIIALGIYYQDWRLINIGGGEVEEE